MKLPYYLLLAAAVTPAFAQYNDAQAPQAKKDAISYDRISVGYFDSKFPSSGWGVSGSALLGDNLILSAGITTLDVPPLGAKGVGVDVSLGYRFKLGAGDFVPSITAGLNKIDDGSQFTSGEYYSFNLNYLLKLNDKVVVSAGYSRSQNQNGLLAKFNDNEYSLGARYYLTKQVSLAASYTFAESNSWGISAGYDF